MYGMLRECNTPLATFFFLTFTSEKKRCAYLG